MSSVVSVCSQLGVGMWPLCVMPLVSHSSHEAPRSPPRHVQTCSIGDPTPQTLPETVQNCSLLASGQLALD